MSVSDDSPIALESVRNFSPITPKHTLCTAVKRAWNTLSPFRNKEEKQMVAFGLSLQEMAVEAEKVGRPIARVPFIPLNDTHTLGLLGSPIVASFNVSMAGRNLKAVSSTFTIYQNGEGEGLNDVTYPVVTLGPASLLPRERSALAETAFHTSVSVIPKRL